MSRLVRTFQARRSRKNEFSPERWAEERAKGRGQFVLRRSFSFAVFMIAFHDVFTHLFYHGGAFRFEFYIFKYWIMGVFFAFWTWAEQESKYKKALGSSPPNTV